MSLLVVDRRFEMSTNSLKEGQDMQKNSMRTNIDPFLKRTNNSPESDPRAVAQRWMDQFHRSLTSTSPASAAELFETAGFWRDFVSFTWHLHTAEGREDIASLAAGTVLGAQPQGWTISAEPTTEDGVPPAWSGSVSTVW